jgi:hypothetical protein
VNHGFRGGLTPVFPAGHHRRRVDTGQPSFFTLGEDEALFCCPAQGNHAQTSENAHGMYQVHGVFVIWLQYLLSGVAPSAVGKADLCRAPVGARIPGAR